jgi:hypothetical protein
MDRISDSDSEDVGSIPTGATKWKYYFHDIIVEGGHFVKVFFS